MLRKRQTLEISYNPWFDQLKLVRVPSTHNPTQLPFIVTKSSSAFLSLRSRSMRYHLERGQKQYIFGAELRLGVIRRVVITFEGMCTQSAALSGLVFPSERTTAFQCAVASLSASTYALYYALILSRSTFPLRWL
jgi:hypothetical protein